MKHITLPPKCVQFWIKIQTFLRCFIAFDIYIGINSCWKSLWNSQPPPNYEIRKINRPTWHHTWTCKVPVSFTPFHIISAQLALLHSSFSRDDVFFFLNFLNWFPPFFFHYVFLFFRGDSSVLKLFVYFLTLSFKEHGFSSWNEDWMWFKWKWERDRKRKRKRTRKGKRENKREGEEMCTCVWVESVLLLVAFSFMQSEDDLRSTRLQTDFFSVLFLLFHFIHKSTTGN